MHGLAVLAFAATVFLGTVSSPPSLLDDVDATYARIAQTMLESGDWATARLNGVVYFDKPPGQVWAIAVSYALFGVHDWVARLPMALAAMAFCWLAWRTGRWAFGDLAGLYAGIGLATCLGLFLFTRARMPDIYVGCASLVALDCFLRAREGSERRARALMRWAGVALGCGMLCKGLVAAVLPAGAIGAYLLWSGEGRSRSSWRRIGLPGAIGAALLVAAPWHLVEIVRHPPYFAWGLDSGPGQYRGFFWRYFVNEHLLRYLGLRFPADYDRVPLLWFWAGHVAWLFPWSGLLAALPKLAFGIADRARRTRSLMLCYCGFCLLFFSASTSQEYYTLPLYGPAMLLLASGASAAPRRLFIACRFAAVMFAIALVAGATILFLAGAPPTGGDIARSLESNPEAYTLALGHFHDLTLGSFAYLRGPLGVAVAAAALGALGGWFLRGSRAALALACASVLVLHAAHSAMATFDPYLSSRPIAEAYLAAPPGTLVLDHEYYAFSSVAYYADRQVLLLNGRRNNIEYGSNAPDAPDVFLNDGELGSLWRRDSPTYLVTYAASRQRFESLLGRQRVHAVAEHGGKLLLSNRPGTASGAPQRSADLPDDSL